MTTPETDKILRSFFTPEGRLKQIPVKKAKRDVVLARLAQEFEEGRRYPESEVNAALLRFHNDFCTLRRELYESKFLDRADGHYWRRSG